MVATAFGQEAPFGRAFSRLQAVWRRHRYMKQAARQSVSNFLIRNEEFTRLYLMRSRPTLVDSQLVEGRELEDQGE